MVELKEIKYEQVETHILPHVKGENSLLNNSVRVVYWVGAFIEDKLVGCNALMKLSKDRARSRSTFVLKEFRGHGIGEQLVKHVTAKAKDEGFKVIEGNSSVKGLMEKLGWTRTDQYFKSWDGWRWKKSLT